MKTAHVDGLVSRPVALDDVWLVVGSSDGRAATWSSLDAGSWVPAEPIDPPPFDELDSGGSSAEWWLNTVVAYAGTQIGLGWEHVGAGDGSQIAIWKSRDGLTWTNVPTRGSTIDTYEIPTDAVVAPDGSLVVATAGGLGSSSSIWMTRDGATWEGHSFSQAGSQSRIDGLAASNQLILAVGTGEGVWSSVDGSTWTTLELPAGAEWLTDVAYDPSKGRFVVVGRRVDARAGVWFTVDGRSWQSTTLSDGPGATWSVEIGGSVTAIGGDLGAEGESAATVWSSHDGVTWRSVTLRERARVEGIDVGGDGTTVLAVQRYEDEFEGGVEVWTGRLVNSP